MAFDAEIDALITRATNVVRIPEQPRQDRILLYANGLKTRFFQVEFALYNLKVLTSAFPQPRGTSSFSDFEKVHFYSDAFWVLSRSAFDILAQLLNQTENLAINESDCEFGSLVRIIGTQTPPIPLAASLTGLQTSNTYRELNSYRNCSLHRRQVYLEGRVTQPHYSTPGYTTPGSLNPYEWILCDDPMAVAPTTASQRKLVDHCENIQRFVENQIEAIVRTLIP